MEGEYLDGEIWNGKGIHIDPIKYITLIGEFSNGKVTKGKEYFDDGILVYEGDYLNGKRWNGKGKEFENDILIYEGEYLNGKRCNGREFINGQLIILMKKRIMKREKNI